MDFIGMPRESNHRRVAVRRLTKEFDDEEEIAEI
jgi:hypothetical protein